MMYHDVDRDHIVSEGSLRSGPAILNYYTTTPAPTQWVAVGVVSTLPGRPKPGPGRRLLVGNGDGELGAMLDLQSQFLRIARELDETAPQGMLQNRSVDTSSASGPNQLDRPGSISHADSTADDARDIRRP